MNDYLGALAVRHLVLLLLLFAPAPFLRRSSASLRHAYWLVGMAWLLALPLLVLMLPQVPLGEEVARRTKVVLPSFADRDIAPATSRVESAPVTPAPKLAAPPHSARDNAMHQSVAPSLLGGGEFLAALWVTGVLAGLVSIAVGLLGLKRLVSSADAVVAADTREKLMAASRSLGLAKEPRLLSSSATRTPVAFGLLRPTIVVPAGLEPTGEVLIHECAHLKRGDWPAILFARLVRSLYWFNPLVWLAEARLRAEAESAADDCVLMAGAAPAEYANMLVSLAARARKGASIAVPVVGNSSLKDRIRRILGPGRRDARVAWSSRATIGMLGAVAALSVASITGPATAHAANALARADDGGYAQVVAVMQLDQSRALAWTPSGERISSFLTPSPWTRNQADSVATGPRADGRPARYAIIRSSRLRGLVPPEVETDRSGTRRAIPMFCVADSGGLNDVLRRAGISAPAQSPIAISDGGSLWLARLDTEGGPTAVLKVWMPVVDRWQAIASQEFAWGDRGKATAVWFRPKIHRTGNRLGVSFYVPKNLVWQDLRLGVDSREMASTSRISPDAAGRVVVPDIGIQAEHWNRQRVTLTLVRAPLYRQATFTGLPLYPKDEWQHRVADPGSPGVIEANGDAAELPDGHTMKLVSVSDETPPSAGSWTRDGLPVTDARAPLWPVGKRLLRATISVSGKGQGIASFRTWDENGLYAGALSYSAEGFFGPPPSASIGSEKGVVQCDLVVDDRAPVSGFVASVSFPGRETVFKSSASAGLISSPGGRSRLRLALSIPADARRRLDSMDPGGATLELRRKDGRPLPYTLVQRDPTVVIEPSGGVKTKWTAKDLDTIAVVARPVYRVHFGEIPTRPMSSHVAGANLWGRSK